MKLNGQIWMENVGFENSSELVRGDGQQELPFMINLKKGKNVVLLWLQYDSVYTVLVKGHAKLSV